MLTGLLHYHHYHHTIWVNLHGCTLVTQLVCLIVFCFHSHFHSSLLFPSSSLISSQVQLSTLPALACLFANTAKAKVKTKEPNQTKPSKQK